MDGNQVGGDHYEKRKIQPVEYIYANGLDFFQGNVIKYIDRHKYKDGAKDVIKAIDYCRMVLKNEYGIELIIEEVKK